MNHDFKTDDSQSAVPFSAVRAGRCCTEEFALWNDGAWHAQEKRLPGESMRLSVEQERDFWLMSAFYLCV